MRVVIPSYGRHDLISSHKLFDDYYIFVHGEEQAKLYRENPTINPDRVIATDAQRGVSYQRQWIIDNFLDKDEWYFAIDDNVKYFTALSDPEYNQPKQPKTQKNNPELKAKYENKIDQARLMQICQEMIVHAEDIGATNLGFATTDNYFFRTTKYIYVGYIISKACIRKNVGINFDTKVQAMDDYYYTAEALLRDGKIVRNDYVKPIANHYQRGGIGTYDERVPKKIADAQYLMAKYPGLFRYKIKKDCHPKAEIQVRFTDLNQVERWRVFMQAKGLL